MSNYVYNNRLSFTGDIPMDHTGGFIGFFAFNFVVVATAETINAVPLLPLSYVGFDRVITNDPDIYTSGLLLQWDLPTETLTIGYIGNTVSATLADIISNGNAMPMALPDNNTIIELRAYEGLGSTNTPTGEVRLKVTYPTNLMEVEGTAFLTGSTTYRVLEIDNDHTSPITIDIWLGVDPVDSDLTVFEIGLSDTGSLNQPTNINTAPSNVTFSKPLTEGSAISCTIPVGGDWAFWVKCTTIANPTPQAIDIGIKLYIKENSVTYPLPLFYNYLGGVLGGVFTSPVYIEDTTFFGSLAIRLQKEMAIHFQEYDWDLKGFNINDQLLGYSITLSKYSQQSTFLATIAPNTFPHTTPFADIPFEDKVGGQNGLDYYNKLEFKYVIEDAVFGDQFDYFAIPVEDFFYQEVSTGRHSTQSVSGSYSYTLPVSSTDHGVVTVIETGSGVVPRSWAIEPPKKEQQIPYLPNDIVTIAGESITIEKITYKLIYSKLICIITENV